MIIQHRLMKWPLDRVVDWTDASERGAWVVELRHHVFNLFTVALDATWPPRKRSWTREQARESLLANKQEIDQLFSLAGAPLEIWREVHIPLPPPRFPDPPEIATGWPSPFQELPRIAWSVGEQRKWLGQLEGQLEYLVALLLMAYPEGRDEHLRARWAVIRLRVLFEKLSVSLLGAPART